MRLSLSLPALAWASFYQVGLALPLNDFTHCVSGWDSWGIACGSVKTCSNAPNVILGQMYHPPSKVKARHAELAPRASTGYERWCQVGTRTYVVMQAVAAVTPANVVSDLLDQAIAYVQNQAALQDGIIGTAGYRRLGAQALTLLAEDANHHQLTWGVLGAALQAVKEYMSQSGNSYGTAYFSIYDGDNQTGKGSIG